MHSKRYPIVLVSALALASLPVLPGYSQARLTNQSKVAINGIGPIRVGMTVAKASRSAGMPLVLSKYPNNGICAYAKPQGGPQGIAFMVINGRIARVDVDKGSRITTRSGAKIGDTEAQIKALYPGQIKVTPHKYTGPQGHYLTFVPKDTQDKNYRLVFETDGRQVTQFRAGKLPEVEYIEGCS